MIDAMRKTLQTSVNVFLNKKCEKALDYKDAFYLATLGGARGNIFKK